MKKNRFLWLFLALLIATTLVLATIALAGSSPYFNKIKNEGKLKIGFNADYEPFCRWQNDPLDGFDVALAKALVDKLGLDFDTDVAPLRVHPADVANLLNNGEIDIAIAGLTVSSERARSVAFTEPYYVATLGALLSRARIPETVAEGLRQPMTIHNLFDMQKLPKLNVGAKKNTTVFDKAKTFFPKINECDSLDDAIDKLNSGELDAFIHEDPFLRYYAATHPNKSRFVVVAGRATYERLAIAIRQGDPDFLNWLNVALQELRDDGSLKRWENLYFDGTGWQQEVQP